MARKKPISVFGYLMDYMNISAGAMASSLHVDPSLISKWKSGTRSLSERSAYFDDVIEYFFSDPSAEEKLDLALNSLFLQTGITNDRDRELLLRKALSGNVSFAHEEMNHPIMNALSAKSNTLSFEDFSGKREAVRKMLDYAESMSSTGEITIVDAEEFKWLLDDEQFAEDFVSSIKRLLKKGFLCRFVIHYNSSKENYVKFFSLCSPLIFDRNVEWFYLHYLNKTVFNISIIMVNRALSLLTISSNNQFPVSTLFSDPSLVIQHEALVNYNMPACSSLFSCYKLLHFTNLVSNLTGYRRIGAFFSILSAPAFITSRPELLKKILNDNHVSDDRKKICLDINEKLRAINADHYSNNAIFGHPYYLIFRIDKMLKRISSGSIVSRSLSLLCKKDITVKSRFYADQLRLTANSMLEHENLHVIIAREEDNLSLPSINCWCKQDTWLLQIDKSGFRVTEDPGIISSAFTSVLNSIEHIPSTRRDKRSVSRYLLELADQI